MPFSPTGSVCESNDRVVTDARFVVLPRLGRHLRRPDATAVDRRVLQDGRPGPQWTDIQRPVFTGD